MLQTSEVLKSSQCGRTRNLHVIYLLLPGKHGAFTLPIHIQEYDVIKVVDQHAVLWKVTAAIKVPGGYILRELES